MSSDRIKVGVKVRPLIKREKSDNLNIHWRAASETQVAQVEPSSGSEKGEPYVFDHVFGPNSSNQEVFEVLVKPIVEAAVRGFNGTIFAYGQTASGKTYTMMGDQYEPGVIPQSVKLIFDLIENSHGREFLLRVCYMEIYNERVNDLLCKSNGNLKVSEDSLGNVVVKDLKEEITSSPQMVMDLMKRGEVIRKIGVTNMNEKSSRSHSIFRVIIESRMAGSDTEEAIQVSHLNLVDLAGSERAGATGSVGDQFKEGCAINKSLFTLGKVISQLSEGEAFVNFRDSKLTRILQSSLGGNALTAIICAITPAALEETNSTLGFASRARNIQNTAQVNEVVSDRALLKRYVKQIDRLSSALSTLEQEKSAETQHLQNQNVLLQERLNRLKDALLTSSDEMTVKSDERLKKLRRRTWSAPNRNVSRLSLAFPIKKKTDSVSSLGNILEDDPCVNHMSATSHSDLSNESLFSTPLEEFEQALIKAEREKSIDETDWLPPVDSLEDDESFKTVDRDTNSPPLNYVQMRTHKSHLRKVLDIDSVLETPPSKLRAKILHVEKELNEINEFTRLEKQMFDEKLSADNEALKLELEKVKKDFREFRAESESLQGIKEQIEQLKITDRNSHDLQMLLLDSSKQVAQLNDENRELRRQVADATSQCKNAVKLKKDFDLVFKEKNDIQQRLAKQEESYRYLQDEKENFDFQLEILKSKHEKKVKELTEALEEARFESNSHHSQQRNECMGELYSLVEEPALEDLMQQVQSLKNENSNLQHKMANKNLLVTELALKQEHISELEKQLLKETQAKERELTNLLDEIDRLRCTNESLRTQLEIKETKPAESLDLNFPSDVNQTCGRDETQSKEAMYSESVEVKTSTPDVQNFDPCETSESSRKFKEGSEEQDEQNFSKTVSSEVKNLIQISEELTASNAIHKENLAQKEVALEEAIKKINQLKRQIHDAENTNCSTVKELQENLQAKSTQLLHVIEESKDLKDANLCLKQELKSRTASCDQETELCELRKNVVDLTNSVKVYEENLAEKEAELEKLKVQVPCEHEAELCELKQCVEDLTSSVKVHEENLAVKEAELEKLRVQAPCDHEAELCELKQCVEDLTSSVKVHKENLAVKEAELEKLKVQAPYEHEAELCELKQCVKDLTSALKVYEENLSEKEKELCELQQCVEDLTCSLKGHEESLAEKETAALEYAAEIELLRSQVPCEHETELCELKQCVKDLTSSVKVHEENLAIKEAELEKLKVQVPCEHEAELCELKQCVQDLTSSVKVHEENLAVKEAELEKLKVQAPCEHETELCELKQCVEDLTNSVKVYEENLAVKEAELEKLKVQAPCEHEAELCELKQCVEDLTSSVKGHEENLALKEAELEKLKVQVPCEHEAELCELKQCVKDLTSSLKVYEENLSEKEKELCELQQCVEDLTCSLKGHEESLAEKETAALEYAAEIELLRSQVPCEHETELCEFKQCVRDLTSSVKVHEENLAIKEAELEKLKVQVPCEYEAELCELKQCIADLTSSVKVHEENLAMKEAELEKLKVQAPCDHETELFELKQCVKDLTISVKVHEENLAVKEAELQKLNVRVPCEHETELCELKQSVADLTSSLKVYEENLAEKETALREYVAEIEQLKSHSSCEHETELCELKQCVKDLTSSLKVCEENLAEKEREFFKLQQCVEDLTCSVKGHEENLAEKETAALEYAAEIDLLRSQDPCKHETELCELKQCIKDLTSSVKVHEENLAQREAELERLKIQGSCDHETELCELKQCVEDLTSSVKIHEENLAEKETALLEYIAEIEQLKSQAPCAHEAELCELKQCVRNLTSSLKVCEENLAKRVAELEQVKIHGSCEHDTELCELKQIVKDLSNSFKVLEETLVEKEAALKESFAKVELLKRATTYEHETELCALGMNVDDLTCSTICENEILVQKEASLLESVAEIERLKRQVEVRDEQDAITQNLQQSLEAKSSLISELMQEAEGLRHANLHLMEELESYKSSLVQLSLETKQSHANLLSHSLTTCSGSSMPENCEDSVSENLHSADELNSIKKMVCDEIGEMTFDIELPLSAFAQQLVAYLKDVRAKITQLEKCNQSCEEDLKSKDNIIHEIMEELKGVKGNAQVLYKTLMLDDVCQNCPGLNERCAELENLCDKLQQEIRNETNLRKSTQEELTSIQEQFANQEMEICKARSSLVTEVKAISDNDSFEDMSLPALIVEFLAAVMKAQERVASVLQLKIDNCTSDLEVSLQRENDGLNIIEQLRNEVKQHIDKNISLQDTIEDLKHQNNNVQNLQNLFQKLSNLVVDHHDVSCEELVSIFVNKLSELTRKSNELDQLQSNLSQLLEENGYLRCNVTVLEKQVLELEGKMKKMKDNVSATLQKLKMEEESLAHLKNEMSKEADMSKDLRAEIVHKEELILKQEDTIKELQQNLQAMTEHNGNLRCNVTVLEKQVLDLKGKMKEMKDNVSATLQKLKMEEESLAHLKNEMSKEAGMAKDLRAEIVHKEELILKQEDTIKELQQNLNAMTKQLGGKEHIQARASSLYLELNEMKELLSKANLELTDKKALLKEKEEKIKSLLANVEKLEKENKVQEASMLRAKAERDVALKELESRAAVTPSEEMKELKAEAECFKELHQESIKSSREIRLRNRKLHAELNKLKEEREESKRSESGNESRIASLQRQLQEEVQGKEDLKAELDILTDQLCKLERSKSSRTSDFRKKREASDAKQSKAEIEILREDLEEKEQKYHIELSKLTNIIQEKESIIKDLESKLQQCQFCQEKSEKITELENETRDLDSECNTLLSWGRGLEENISELIARFSKALKNLSETESRLSKVSLKKLQFVVNLSKERTAFLDSAIAEQIEMQLSSKEKATRNAKTRSEDLVNAIELVNKETGFLDFDKLECLCSDLHKENDVLVNLDEEVSSVWQKISSEKKQPSKQCSECKLLKKWGQEEEAKATALTNQLSRLEGELVEARKQSEVVSQNTRSSRKKLNEPSTQACQCADLEKIVQTQRSELALKKAEIVTLKMKEEMQSKPAEDTIKRLQEKLKLSKEEMARLKAENRRIVKNYEENTVCVASRKVVPKKDMHTQTAESSHEIYKSQYWAGAPSGIVEESNRALLENKCRKLEQEKEVYKTLCVKRKERIESLEIQIKKTLQENGEKENNEPRHFTRSMRNN